jgi:hypothetical protein
VTRPDQDPVARLGVVDGGLNALVTARLTVERAHQQHSRSMARRAGSQHGSQEQHRYDQNARGDYPFRRELGMAPPVAVGQRRSASWTKPSISVYAGPGTAVPLRQVPNSAALGFVDCEVPQRPHSS